jgi:L-ascorbate 6-phosphate lactonase
MSLLYDIEEIEIKKNKLKIFYLGQSGYVLKTKESFIYIDPYLSNYIQNSKGLNDNYMTRSYPSPLNPKVIKKCNAIICTHSHVDHMDPWTLKKINTDFILYCSEGAYNKSVVEKNPSNLIFLKPRKSLKIKNLIIEPIPAAHYNLKDKYGRPDCLSLIIKFNNQKLFFWGDGIIYDGQLDLLSNIKFDYFFAPINGRDIFREKKGIIGNLNEKELAKICSKINIDNVIPNHYDMFPNNTGSIKLFMEEINKNCPKQNIIILKCGESIEV